MGMSTQALDRAREAYEERTDLKPVQIRLSSDARKRLNRLSDRYGGKRQAVERALKLLESKA